MPVGYAGKLLFVDLSAGRISEEALDEQMCKDFIGGYGIASRILFSRMPANADPLGPANIFGITTGPYSGTNALFASRFTTVGKSPLTGTWGDANSGGNFGPFLKMAGYDAVFFSGIADKPVYLLIDRGKAELKDASNLWGRDVNETEGALEREYGRGAHVACIGPASEKLSLITGVVNDRGRIAARSGLGAVMGSKKLKAVVVRGSVPFPVANDARLRQLRTQITKGFAGPTYDMFRGTGTAGAAAGSARSGDSPVKNWGGVGIEDFPNVAQISDTAVIAKQAKKYGCWRCPMACGGHMVAGQEYPFRAGSHQPEYETLAAFGTMNLVDNLDAVLMVNDICNRYGFDTISAGTVVSFAMELYEKGIITRQDTDGLELTWGNHQAMVALMEKMAKREGFGDVLADGVKLAAQRIGKNAEQYAMHVQGEAPGMHDPKFGPHWGVTYQFDATPGRHTQGSEGLAPPDLLYYALGETPPPGPLDARELRQRLFSRTQYSGRAKLHMAGSHYTHVMNSVGMCMFGSLVTPARGFIDMLNAVTGWNYDFEDVLKAGERIANVRHSFNLREGLNPWSFKVPGRIFGKPPMTRGPHEGIEVDIDTMAREYLEAMDWDPLTTKPSRKKLEELGLKDVAEAIAAS